MQIDRQFLAVIRPKIIAALQELAEEYDISFETGNAKFTPTNATMKIEIATKNEEGVTISKAERERDELRALLQEWRERNEHNAPAWWAEDLHQRMLAAALGEEGK